MLIDQDPLNAFVDYPDVPVAHAEKGPLSGLTFAVKDIFDVAGYPTGCGNPDRQAETPPATAHTPAVAALLDAGATFVGKTHTVELAFSLDGRNVHYPPVKNPAAPGRVPGGSSSGSAAAVAGGLVDIAIGSDTGGSIRSPASFCGLIGLRTTHGRVDISRAMPLAPSFDTVGWFARDADLYDRVANVLLGRDHEAPPLRRMIFAEDAWALLTGGAEDAVLRPLIGRIGEFLQPLGARTIASEGLGAWAGVFRSIQGFEAWKAHGEWITKRQPRLTDPTRMRFEVASRVTPQEYEEASRRRVAIRRHLEDLLGDDTVIVLPTVPTIALRYDAPEKAFEDFRAQAIQMLCIAGLGGLPQISLPLGMVEGCPIGLSLIGPHGRDRALIELAEAVLAE